MHPQFDFSGLSLDYDFRSKDSRRRSFFNLAADVFGLSFEEWHRQGYWTDRYRPYALFDGDRAVANVSVNLIDFVRDGVVIIAEEEAGELICYDVYGNGRTALADIPARIVGGDGQMVRFGFALKNQPSDEMLSPIENDEALFILSGRDNVFTEHKIMFPLLSHA